MSKRINSTYQTKKQKIKDFFDLKPKDRQSYLFEKEHPDFPVSLIPDRLRIGLLTISFLENPSLFPVEGKPFSIELPTFGIIS